MDLSHPNDNNVLQFYDMYDYYFSDHHNYWILAQIMNIQMTKTDMNEIKLLQACSAQFDTGEYLF